MQDLNFEKTIQPLTNKMYRLAKRLLISHEEAQDATQEVLFKLYKNNTWINIEAYAISSVKNYCLDVLKSKRSQQCSINEKDFFTENNSLINEIEGRNNFEIIEKIIENLPETQKIIIQLREIEQMEYDEIAKIMEMNITAVRMQLSRARKIIKLKFIKINNYGI
ncbi:MAG: RNA polymerase sigma factor [Flavobacterium sp.]|jgi:RNA polymerase sigma factor (sigma-70 family)